MEENMDIISSSWVVKHFRDDSLIGCVTLNAANAESAVRKAKRLYLTDVQPDDIIVASADDGTQNKEKR